MNDHDFAAAWHTLTANDPNHRGESAVDLAFWESHAQGYDENANAPGRSAATLAAIKSLVRPDDTLLDVGAGTGRFSLPLADSVKSITALDHAAPMLDVLKQKMADQQITNIHLQETPWENAEVVEHDVVLAAWSLYRLPDITTGMRKLIEATKRTLVVVASPGGPPADTPLHIYFYGALWQAGVYPEIKIVWEQLADVEQPRPVALIVWHRRAQRSQHQIS